MAPGPRIQPVLFPAVALALAGVVHIAFPLPGIPMPVRWAGIPLAAAGLTFIVWAIIHQFRRGNNPEIHKPTHALVTDGPYRVSRNPIYLGFLSVQAGAALLLGWWIAIALLPASWRGLLDFVIRPEERHLAAQFGDAYASYCRRVRRWL